MSPIASTTTPQRQRDGNCAFRALARFEYKTEARHREIRRLVCERLKEAPGAMEVTALVEGVTVEEYLDRMARDTTWVREEGTVGAGVLLALSVCVVP